MSVYRLSFVLGLLCFSYAQADILSEPDAKERSPSKDQILWTQTNLGYDVSTEYTSVFPSSINFGEGRATHLREQSTDTRLIATRRELMAFLFHAGIEWQRLGFNPPNTVLVPDEVDALTAFLAMDMRWSDKSMIRLQMQPGIYSDMQDVTASDLNIPIALAYTRVPSRRFQWAIGLSINTLRGKRYLPGGGFRWQINNRWRLKFMLPNPQIEYKANEVLHLWVGSDFRGDTYRVSSHFGTDRGVPALDNALLDYQEIHSGVGFSWNIKPLIELNGEVGYMTIRELDYHNNGISAIGRPAPYLGLNLHILFQAKKDMRPIPAQLRSMQVQFPSLNRYFELPK